MPYRRRASYGRRRTTGIVNSITNRFNAAFGVTGTTASVVISKAVNTPLSTVQTDVSQGCIIKAIYVSIDGCGLGGTGVLNNLDFYLFKSVGDNLTPPAPISAGASNEKRFIIKFWHFMIMRNQDGNTPFHWEGWVRIPKKYQRMATDDTWRLVHACSATLTGHMSFNMIYKWYR